MNTTNGIIGKSPILQEVQKWISEPSVVRIVFGKGVLNVSSVYINEWVENTYEGLFTRTVSTQTTSEQEMMNYINRAIDGPSRCQSAVVFARFRTAFSEYLNEQWSLLEGNKRDLELKKQNIIKEVSRLMMNYRSENEEVLQDKEVVILLLLSCFGKQWSLLEGKENVLRFKIEHNVKLALEVITEMKNPISDVIIEKDSGLSIINRIIDSDIKKVLLFVAVVALSLVALATDLRVMVMGFMIFDLLLSVILGKEKVD